MKNLNKKILIIFGILLVSILIAAIGYNNYSKNKTIDEFTTYIDNYKQQTSTYDLNDKKEEYENLIEQCEQAINNNDYKNIEYLKSNLSDLKGELFTSNIESINKFISELEAIDISTLPDKEPILFKIQDIKTLRDENQFIKANEELSLTKNELINKIKLKEEALINDNFQKFDGYWLGEIDSQLCYKIDIQNNSVYQQASFKPLKHPLNSWSYDSTEKSYTINCEWKNPNPETGFKDYYIKISYIDDDTVKIFDKTFRRATYEEVAYYMYYSNLISPVGTDGIIYKEIKFLDGFSPKNKEQINLSVEDAKTLVTQYYSKDLANGYKLSNVSIGKSINIIPGINSYTFGYEIGPIDNKPGDLTNVKWKSGVIFENGIIIKEILEKSGLDFILQDLKAKILTYYQ